MESNKAEFVVFPVMRSASVDAIIGAGVEGSAVVRSRTGWSMFRPVKTITVTMIAMRTVPQNTREAIITVLLLYRFDRDVILSLEKKKMLLNFFFYIFALSLFIRLAFV